MSQGEGYMVSTEFFFQILCSLKFFFNKRKPSLVTKKKKDSKFFHK